MTERKKEYIIDALGEIEDEYVAEAAEYVKPVRKWRYWRECGAVAACVGAVVITAAAWQHLPIGQKAAMENTAAKQEMVTQEAKPESFWEEKAPESAEEDFESSAVGVEEESEQSTLKSQNIAWDVVYEEIEGAENILDINKEAISSQNQLIGQESLKLESIEVYRSAEEILAEGRDIFLGEVTEKQIYKLTEGFYHYFTLLTVRVEESIRGELKAGEEYRIYLPVAATERVIQDNSLSGDLTKLKVGSRAVFMPLKAGEGAITGANALLYYADFADYYFEEGMRYLFLEEEKGISYAEEVYKLDVQEGTETLEDAAAYLKALLSDN